MLTRPARCQLFGGAGEVDRGGKLRHVQAGDAAADGSARRRVRDRVGTVTGEARLCTSPVYGSYGCDQLQHEAGSFAMRIAGRQ